ELAADVEVRVVVGEPADVAAGEEFARFFVSDDLVTAPGVEELPGRLQEGLGPLIAGILRQEAGAPEVLAGERVPRGDHIPCGPSAREMIQAPRLPSHPPGVGAG